MLSNAENQRNYIRRLKERANMPIDLDAEKTNMTPLEYMISLLNDPNVPVDLRLKAASMAAPYVHARVESTSSGKKEERQAAAEEADKGQFASANPPRLVA